MCIRDSFCRPSIWRHRWLKEETYQTKTVDEVWAEYEGSFYQKTDSIIKFVTDKRDRIRYLISRVPYRTKEYIKRKSGKNI